MPVLLSQISIHAPLTGCDTNVQIADNQWNDISIHAPLTGCDIATSSSYAHIANFNPRTPYGMRQNGFKFHYDDFFISIHAPLTGCDSDTMIRNVEFCCISIHAPLTGCDCDNCSSADFCISISIHAPLTGCDTSLLSMLLLNFYFNPRTPYGMRLLPILLSISSI